MDYAKVRCPVPGCYIVSYPEYIKGHATKPHEDCPVCGWRGISLANHLGQVKRRGYGPTHKAVLPADRLADIVTRMRLDGDPFVDDVAEIVEALRRRPEAATAERDEVGPTDWSVLAPRWVRAGS